MNLKDAVQLIQAIGRPEGQQEWADLGAGKGLFTSALASLLEAGSVIHAIDKDAASLNQIHIDDPQIHLKKIRINFLDDNLELGLLDGILMANALHFVEDKLSFIKRLKKSLKREGKLLIVEYERETGNQWVPYPINFVSLQKFFKEAGFTSVVKLGERPSLFNQGNIYSAVASN